MEVETVQGGVDVEHAVRDVLRESRFVSGLARGIDESVKVLEQSKAKLCILAKDCGDANYTKLVQALCKEKECPLVYVDERTQLGELAGLCQIDRDGKARKVVACACVVVHNYGKDTPAKDTLLKSVEAN